MSEKTIIAVDFDGTIVSEDYPEIGMDLGGAYYLWQAKNLGCEMILWTCRSEERLDAALRWLERNGYDGLFDAVNDHAPSLPDFPGAPSRKVYAHVYVGDRALGAPFKRYHDPERRDHFDWKVAGPALLDIVAARVKAAER